MSIQHAFLFFLIFLFVSSCTSGSKEETEVGGFLAQLPVPENAENRKIELPSGLLAPKDGYLFFTYEADALSLKAIRQIHPFLLEKGWEECFSSILGPPRWLVVDRYGEGAFNEYWRFYKSSDGRAITVNLEEIVSDDKSGLQRVLVFLSLEGDFVTNVTCSTE